MTRLRRGAATAVLLLVLGGCCSLDVIRTEALPDGQVGRSYAADLEADCEGDQLEWVLISGGLPPGVSLSRDGALRGTPTLSGTFTMTVEVHERSSFGRPQFIAKGFAITVLP